MSEILLQQKGEFSVAWHEFTSEAFPLIHPPWSGLCMKHNPSTNEMCLAAGKTTFLLFSPPSLEIKCLFILSRTYCV